MIVVKSTGLVPVFNLGRAAHLPKGAFGLPPAKAIAAQKAGEVRLLTKDEMPADIEIDEVGRSEEEVPAPEKPVLDIDSIVIPEGWDKPHEEGGLHHLQKIKLAKDIGGLMTPVYVPTDGKWTVAEADMVIAEEVQRRAAAVSAQT